MNAGGDAIGNVPGIPDSSRPNAARVYDYLLGGAANLAVDRELGRQIIGAEPRVVPLCRANRAFLARAVRFCVVRGVRQFLDLGSGIPTVRNVHEIATRADPRCRVAYVDVEPTAVAHSARLLADEPSATITHADLRAPERVLAAPGVADFLDLSEPVAVLAVMVLQSFPETESITEHLAEYGRRLSAGGILVLSHLTADDPTIDMTGIAAGAGNALAHAHPRTRAEFTQLFGNAELIEPGVSWVNDWWPDAQTAPGTEGRFGVYVGAARFP